jgi:hypothetical protein
MNTIALALRDAALPIPGLPSLPKLPSWRQIRRAALAIAAAGVLMAVTHTTAVRSTIATTVLALLDAGTPPGHIIMATSGVATVATLTLASTSFTISSGVGTAAAIASDTNAVGGTIALALFKNAAGTEIFRCSVTATGGGGDIEMNSVVVSAGQTVAITSLTYTAPA